MAGNNWRYQNPYMPNGGNPEETNIPIANFRYAGQIGTIHTALYKDADGVSRTKTFMLVKTNATLAVAPFNGCPAYWSNQDDNEVSTALVRGRPAGVFINVPGVSSVCFIQILGRHPNVRIKGVPTATPTNAGLFVIPDSAAGACDCLAAGTAATYPPLGLSVSGLTGNDAAVFLTVGNCW